MKKIFFSYSRVDGSAFTLKLARDLKSKGFDVWIDQEDIRAGSEWDIEIEKALDTCDCLLFVETEKSVLSNNVLDEVYYALEQHKKVIPLILVDSKTPFRLKRLQHIDFTKDYNTGFAQLTNELEDTTSSIAFQPEQSKLMMKGDKRFYEKYAKLLLIITSLAIIIIAAIIYKTNNSDSIPGEKDKLVNVNDTVTNDQAVVGTKSEAIAKNDAAGIGGVDDNKIIKESPKKTSGTTSNGLVNKTITTTADLNETFAGDWKLVDVQPKAKSVRGYLKIESIDEKKVTIKSYMQFYYFKTNEVSFLSVFNAFAGCASCNLERDMKITAEDIAIGSRTIKTLKEDQANGGKAGDTIMDAGSNKSIRASVTLQLIDNKTAVIKVQQPAATELAHQLILEPFVYSFRFNKVE